MISFFKAARVARSVGFVAALAVGAAGIAQSTNGQATNGQATNGQAGDQPEAEPPAQNTGLNIPSDVQLFGKLDPNVRKATAIVNGSVITGTDVDQRVALIEATNNIHVTGDELNRLKLQVLRGLIDETLEVQEAKANKVEIKPAEIEQGFDRVAKQLQMTPAQFKAYLVKIGSSARSMNLQIQAQLAWRNYLENNVTPFVNVGDREVQAILDRLKASKGTEEYHLKEIFMSASGGREAQVHADMQNLMKEIQKGQHPFEYFAQFSQASTRSVGGDLSWVRTATLPAPLAEAAQGMEVGQIAGPIPNSGGFSILYLVDKRQVLTADPRDARLSLRQLTIDFPAGTTQQQATQRAAKFAQATQNIHGCGDVDKIASQIGAQVVDNDQVTVRQLPPQLQSIILKLKVGEATPPFGSATEGVRSLVLCGRDDPQSGQLPPADQVQNQLEQKRVNLRAEQVLRDLRRDAVVEYR